MKIMRSLTIVPAELYIDREADRQIDKILKDMGRPGYVLVARQMGKTNLLLNAKRRHSGAGKLFVYLDASNPFPDIRSFFRNITDTALEIAGKDMSLVAQRIAELRHSESLLPHKEHERELRMLIASGLHRLTICLDEIDALTRCEYSDQVFSFIRSVYFSGRSNFPEFGFLTYLLSGVAEPADIIKNKDISPFNIGEKIYLDDFSERELAQLARRANLQVPDSVIDRIYEWVRGYPRMCWDVCSAVEDHVATDENVDQATIDSIIQKLYFSDVDSPPIDHIKRIAEDNSEVRDALMSIHYGRSETLTDQLRTKLYLAGVTKMTPADKVVNFKNRVLEESLSESFLRAISEKNPRSRIAECIALYRDGAHDAVLSRLPLPENLAQQEDRNLVGLLRGKSLFHLGRFAEAGEALRLLSADQPQESIEEIEFFLGVSLARSSRAADAIPFLRKSAIGSGDLRFDATVELVLALSSFRDNEKDVEEICRRLTGSPAGLLSARSEIRTPAENLATLYLALAQCQIKRGDVSLGRRTVEEAIPYCTVNMRIRATVVLFDIDAAGHKLTLLKQALSLLKSSSGVVADASRSTDLVSIETIFALLQRAESIARKAELNEFLGYLTSETRAGIGVSACLNAVIEMCLEQGEQTLGITVLEHGLAAVRDLPPSEVRQLYATLILLSPQRVAAHRDLYLRTFQLERAPSLRDYAPLNNIIVSETFHPSSAAAAMAIEVLNRDPSDQTEITQSQLRSLGHLREYLISYRALGSTPDGGDFAVAKDLLERLSREKTFDLPGFADEHYRRMQTGLGNLLRRHGIKVDIRRGEKFGRNEYVEVDYGEFRRTGKFKKFEDDLRSGACRLVGRASPARASPSR